MMEIYLKDALFFCLIVFVIALIVLLIQLIFILFDIRGIVKQSRKMFKDLEKKIKAVTSIFDVASLILGGVEEVKKRVIKQAISKTNWKAFIAGLRKGVKVLLGGEK